MAKLSEQSLFPPMWAGRCQQNKWPGANFLGTYFPESRDILTPKVKHQPFQSHGRSDIALANFSPAPLAVGQPHPLVPRC